MLVLILNLFLVHLFKNILYEDKTHYILLMVLVLVIYNLHYTFELTARFIMSFLTYC